ncbi:MAG: recombinase family protein, partial [Eubacteriales bacterium]|nr:recombinase family protein [Eubacteriales bacterium]
EYFEKLLNQKASDIFSSSQNEKELSDIRKKKAQLETAISNQVKNLREADDSLKRFIQEDVKAITDELAEIEILLQKLEGTRQSQMYAIRNIEEIKERLLSFGKYAEMPHPMCL